MKNFNNYVLILISLLGFSEVILASSDHVPVTCVYQDNSDQPPSLHLASDQMEATLNLGLDKSEVEKVRNQIKAEIDICNKNKNNSKKEACLSKVKAHNEVLGKKIPAIVMHIARSNNIMDFTGVKPEFRSNWDVTGKVANNNTKISIWLSREHSDPNGFWSEPIRSIEVMDGTNIAVGIYLTDNPFLKLVCASIDEKFAK